MERFFIYDGISSSDFGIIIKRNNHINSPSRDVEKVHIEGRNGDLLFDKGSYQNKVIEVECIVNGDLNSLSTDIKKWILENKGYKRLTFSDDSECYYEACVMNSIDFEKIIKTLGTFIILFNCKPLKKIELGDSKITLTTPKKIFNYWHQSEPSIKIFGSGDITVNINTQELILKGVQGQIIIDSEIYNAYKIDIFTNEIVNENSKMYSEFPVLEEGQNNISWVGNVISLEIIPRWVVL